MQYFTTLALAVAGLVSSASAFLNEVTVYSGEGCTGNSVELYTSVSQDYCFEGYGGSSFGGFESTCGQGGGFMTTWSGANCEGSSAVFEYPQGCQTIPFASVELFCYE